MFWIRTMQKVVLFSGKICLNAARDESFDVGGENCRKIKLISPRSCWQRQILWPAMPGCWTFEVPPPLYLKMLGPFLSPLTSVSETTYCQSYSKLKDQCVLAPNVEERRTDQENQSWPIHYYILLLCNPCGISLTPSLSPFSVASVLSISANCTYFGLHCS